LEAIEVERAAILEGARREAADEAQAVLNEADELRRRLARAGRPLEEAKAAARAARELAEASTEPIRPAVPAETPPMRIGSRVFLRSLGTEGILETLSEREAEVRVGQLRVRAAVEDLAPPRSPGSAVQPVETARPRALPSVSSSMEIDLRGLPVDEALTVLEQRLDSAFLAGMPFVRIIHGKGTGRLRQAIRRELRDNPYAAGYEPGKDSEGGEGVTVVKLATS
jgi:DNA mismatch repair protein MutS2